MSTSTSRREFLIGCAACAVAGSASGCAAVNPAPVVEADSAGGFPLEGRLGAPGDQVKVRLAGEPTLVLVWRTPQGFGAASIVCTHRGSEVHYNAGENTLDCPSHGSRFAPDGKVIHGPAKEPLAAYVATADGRRLTVRRA
jgi:Rieske Fe-S protein